MNCEGRGRLAGSHCCVESGQESGNHVMVLTEHADHARSPRVLLDEGGKQQRVLSAMMPVERNAEAMAEKEEIARCVCDVGAVVGGILRGVKCET